MTRHLSSKALIPKSQLARRGGLFVIVLSLAIAGRLTGWELSGYIAGEGRLFMQDPLYDGQDRHNASMAVQPQIYHRFSDSSSLTFTGFARADSADPHRTHLDLRELNYLYRQDEFEMRLGICKVFWGVTEFVHLVDIVNQTDLVEDIDGEEKLGQPMIQFTLPARWGRVDLIWMPYFRQRTFPGRSGRLRPALYVDPDVVIYESPEGRNRWDFVARYSRSLGSCDIGLYVFNGTDRQPLLFPTTNRNGQAVLGSFYQEITQLGLDAQYSSGNWLWKIEAIYKDGYFEGHSAATGGLEYTCVNLAGTRADLGLIVEYAYDELGDRAQTPYNHDLMFGLRFSPNDAASTYLLAGLIQDVKDTSRILIVEASRRLGSHWRMSLELWAFLDTDPGDSLYGLRNDDFARLEIAYCF